MKKKNPAAVVGTADEAGSDDRAGKRVDLSSRSEPSTKKAKFLPGYDEFGRPDLSARDEKGQPYWITCGSRRRGRRS